MSDYLNRSIYIKNLSENTTEDKLREHLNKIGSIEKIFYGKGEAIVVFVEAYE
jgi:RNA recognition motif-containing protein